MSGVNMKIMKKKRLWGISFLILLAFFSWAEPGCSQARATGARVVVKEISLGKIHPGIVRESLQISLKANRVAYAAKSGEKYLMVIDGVAGKEYDGLHMPKSIFSSDEKTAIYGAWRDKKIFIVVNGQEGKPYARISLITYSPDGKKIAYWAATGEKEDNLKGMVVIDGKEGPTFDWIGESTPGPIGHSVKKYVPVFSPNSSRLAYVALSGNQELVVVDGKEWARYDEIASFPIFSPDSKKVAYLARKGGQWLVVVDGIEGKKYERIENLMFSPDGQKIAYIAFHNDNQLVVVNGNEGPEYQMVDRVTFSPDGKHLAYVADIGQKQVLVVDGKESKQYDMINHFVFCPDSKHLAFSALAEQKEVVVVDGAEKSKHRFVVSLNFSPDSQKIVYTGRDDMDKVDLFINGEKAKNYDEISSWVFSPDGKRMVYWARRNGKNFIVINGKEDQAYDLPDYLYQAKYEPVFSSDGQHLAYVAVKEGKNVVVVDGVESKEYDEILSPVVFDSASKFHYLAINQNEIFKVEGTIVQNSSEAHSAERVLRNCQVIDGADIFSLWLRFPLQKGCPTVEGWNQRSQQDWWQLVARRYLPWG